MPEIKLCPFCGEKILTIAKKCRYCGEFLDIQAKLQAIKPVAKSRTTYLLLGLFFGGIGAHNFYSGHNPAGRIKIYLLFLPVIGWTISAFITIYELCTVEKDSSGNPLV